MRATAIVHNIRGKTSFQIVSFSFISNDYQPALMIVDFSCALQITAQFHRREQFHLPPE